MAQERQPTRTRAVGTDLNRNWSHQWGCCGASSATPFSELVLWPYGYTRADTAPGLATDDQMARAAIGRDMAATNRYTPEQASDLYIADGTIIDWLRGTYKIFTYTLEMYPAQQQPGLPPAGRRDRPRDGSEPQGRAAAARDLPDCPYRAIGKETQYCGCRRAPCSPTTSRANAGGRSPAAPAPRAPGSGPTLSRPTSAAASSSARRRAASGIS